MPVASSSGAWVGWRRQQGSHEQDGHYRLTDYGALSIARSSADRARHCSR
jgi:hypothetical protein